MTSPAGIQLGWVLWERMDAGSGEGENGEEREAEQLELFLHGFSQVFDFQQSPSRPSYLMMIIFKEPAQRAGAGGTRQALFCFGSRSAGACKR